MKKFLKTLRDAGILLKVVEGELKLTAPKGALTPELLQELKARKPELMAYLNAQENQAAFHAIAPLGAQASYALSPAQYRLWVLSQLDDALVAYNMPAAKLLTGTLDVASFEQALHAVVARHEILRTVFRKDEQLDDVRQFVLAPEAAGFALTYTDLSAEADPAAAARAYVAAEALRPFDLSTGPLFRAALLRLSADELVFFFNMHHIISDGWSMKVLTNELLRFYQQCSQGQAPAAEPLRVQYKDFAAWQRTELAGAGLQSHRAYWLEQLQGELPVLELQQAQPRPAVKTYNGDMLQFRLSPEVQAGLKQLSETRGGTTFMGLVAALNTLLYRYTGQEDIILGSPIAGREHADLENQIGFYINTLALRTQFSANDSFAQLYEQVKTNLLGAYKHQIYPFDQLVDDLGVKRDVSRSPLFDVLVVMQNTDLNFSKEEAGQSGAELRIDNWKIDGRLVSKYDLTLAFTEGAQGIDVLLQYNTDLFAPAYIERLFNHFAQLLAHIVQAPELPLHAFEYLSPAETHRQTISFNDNHLPVAQPATLHELFAQRAAALLPERAVVCDDRSLTYQQLDELSNQLAGYLLDHYRLQPNDLVGLMLERNEWYVVAVLAALKAGGAFVPIDLAYPEERISYLQRNSAPTVVLNEAELAEFRRQQPNYATLAPRPATTAQDLAYVIYTSGSTGEPKGVMIEHRAIVNTVLTEISSLDMQPGIRGMQFMSSSFDVSVWEIFTILLAGGELHIAGEALKKDAAAYTQYLNDNCIDIAAMPPVYLQLLDIEQLRHLRQLVTGGEETNRKLVQAFCQQGDYINAYGPTEAAVVAAKHIIKRGTYTEADKIPIGKPIGNTQAYLLDAHGNLLPEGQVGQLYLGGPGLSRGYLNREELTAEKFVSNPFEPGALLYDTGDLARWTPDGELVFAGRKDSQVKIRGHRVELREIENALLSVPEVRDAVVLAREMSDQTRELVAYVVSPAGGSAKQLKAYLAQRLPAYMVPSYFVPLERLPTTSNGKINKVALPAPTAQHAASVIDYVAPANQIEETLVQIWQELLGKDQIGTSANFFDLGGNSIKIIKLNQLINAAFAKSYKIATFFNVVTIKDQAAFIAQDAANPEAAAGQEEQMEELVQSFDESLELFNN